MSLLNKLSIKNTPAKIAINLPGFSLDLLEKLLFVVIFISLACVVVSMAGKPKFASRQDIFQIFPPSLVPQDVSPKMQKDYASFAKSLNNKKIFASLYIEEKKDIPVVDTEKLSRVIENLRLAGILSRNPPKVIIEDKKTGKSFYLKSGETFLDSIKLEKISKDSILLNYQGENFELYF